MKIIAAITIFSIFLMLLVWFLIGKRPDDWFIVFMMLANVFWVSLEVFKRK